MGLVGPWLSTTSTKKKKEKITKKKQEDLERDWRERNVRLKEMHLPKETFEQYLEWVYGQGNKKAKTSPKESSFLSSSKGAENYKTGENYKFKARTDNSVLYASSKNDTVKGPCSSKPAPVYTGSKMIGVGTMHKSNMVPIFSDDEAKDISTMRR